MTRPVRRKPGQAWKKILTRLAWLFIFIIFIWLGFSFWQIKKRSRWDGKHQLNFVVQAEKILVYSFHPEDGILNILAFDNKTHIPAAKGFGEYPIENIYKLGQSEKIGGGRLLSLSLSEFLAVPLDGHFVQIKNKKLKIKNDILLCRFNKKCLTDFGWWDLLKIWQQFSKLKPGQIKEVDFTETGVLKEKTLADGSLILQPDYLRIDQLSLNLFSDKSVLDEGLTVSVLNGSNITGLANQAGRLVKNLGCQLVNTSDADKQVDKSAILYKNKELKNSYTLKRLVKAFEVKEVRQDSQIEPEIVLLIGKDVIFIP